MRLNRERILSAARLALLLAICWIARDVQVSLREGGARPITVREVQALVPACAELERDANRPGSLRLLDTAGQPLGHVWRTSPRGDGEIGYAGPSDVLLTFDEDDVLVGAALRRSADTPGHVADVRTDERFWSTLLGHTPAQLSKLELDGVAGATRTSGAVIRAIRARCSPAAEAPVRPPLRPSGQDWAIGAIAAALALTPALRGKARGALRRGLRLAGLLYLGLATGELLALSLAASWSAHPGSWRAAPGLALLGVAALLVPAFGGGPAYCKDVCPAGSAQRWLARVSPARWRLSLPDPLDFALRLIPGALLLIALIVALLALPLDLAGLEVFDAFGRGWVASVAFVLAILGLALAPFIPMAYCRYGCPTGALLEYARPRGRGGLRAADGLAVLCFLVAWLLADHSLAVWHWLEAGGTA